MTDSPEVLASSMPIDAPILSFAIPTWNRAGNLKNCVDLIAAQISTTGLPVEIVVSDNGSDDETPHVIEQLRTKYAFLHSLRSEVNLGFDRNLLRVLQAAHGEYVWIFSDDDFLADGALNAVLELISEHRPDNISTNYHSCDGHGKLLAEQREAKWMLPQDVAQADLDCLFSTQGMRISFISRLIFRRDRFDFAEYERVLPDFPHWLPVYITAHTTAGRSAAYLSSFYAVNWRPGHARENPDVFLYQMPETFDRILSRFGASAATRKRVIDDIRQYFITWRSYLKFRSQNVRISPLLAPAHYRLLPKIPYFLAEKFLIWRDKRKH